MQGSLLRTGVAFMGLMSAGAGFAQMYYPDVYDLPPPPFPRHRPLLFGPYPPMDDPYYYRPPLRPRPAARLMEPFDEPPPRPRPRHVAPPVEQKSAQPHGDQGRSARAPVNVQENKSKPAPKSVTAHNESQSARAEPSTPLPPTRPSAPPQPTASTHSSEAPRPSAAAQQNTTVRPSASAPGAPRAAPVAIGAPANRPAENIPMKRSALDDASSFTNRGEMKSNLE